MCEWRRAEQSSPRTAFRPTAGESIEFTPNSNDCLENAIMNELNIQGPRKYVPRRVSVTIINSKREQCTGKKTLKATEENLTLQNYSKYLTVR